MSSAPRQSTGIAALDQHLGGGLLPGTMTVLLGATGIGKTQLGVSFAQQGAKDEAYGGVIFDMCSRGDSQNHADYAQRIGQWTVKPHAPLGATNVERLFNDDAEFGDYLHIFEQSGLHVTRDDMDFDQWHDWQGELNQRLGSSIEFLYGNFVRGCRRVVIDGIEPVQRSSQSIQFRLLEYIYHQVIRKEADWVARDLFRQSFRKMSAQVQSNLYQQSDVGCLALWTSQETMLDDLIERPIQEGDILSNANTIIVLGKTRDGNKMGRAMYIAKHRGSACSEQIIPFTIQDQGIVIEG